MECGNRAQLFIGRRPNAYIICAGGRKLMRRDVYQAPNPNFTGEFDVLSNAGTSSYNALQAQYRHRLSHGLQTLFSCTWGHSIDNVSADGNFLNAPFGESSGTSERGPSDYDLRNTLSGAVTYDIPGPKRGVLRQIVGNWSTNSIIYVGSAPPVNVVTGSTLPRYIPFRSPQRAATECCPRCAVFTFTRLARLEAR